MKSKVFGCVVVLLTGLLVIGCGGSSGGDSDPDGFDPNNLVLTMVSVPGGSFQPDATSGNGSTVSTFRISAHEITRAQFKAVMGVDPSDLAHSSGNGDPVQNVNWYHAIAFCNMKSIEEGLTPVYTVTVSGVPLNWASITYADIPTTGNADWNLATANWSANGYRLPTELEWMWAAMGAPADGRAGGENSTGHVKGYAGSTEGATQTNIWAYAWCIGNSDNTTHPVGRKLPNELGLYDMSGNVWEWCWDWYAGYPSGVHTDYRGASSGTERVVRGGSWDYYNYDCTVAGRFDAIPGGLWEDTGFRVARN